MVTTKELFSQALMIELPWFIEKLEFDQSQGKFDVWIDFARGSEFFFRGQEIGDHWEIQGIRQYGEDM